MAATNIVSGLFSVAVFIYLARTLQPGGFGYFSYAQSIAFYLLNFVDLGLSTYGIREISKDRSIASRLVSEMVSFKTFIACCIFIAFIPITFLSYHSNTLRIVIVESCLLLFVAGLATEWAFQGLEKMHMVFVSFAVTNFLQLALIYAFVKGPKDLLKAPALYALAALPVIIVFLRRLNFKPMISGLDLKRIKFYLSTSIVIWSISILAQVYNGLDIVILGLFRGIKEVGYFSAARRLIGGITCLLIFLANALLPRLSYAYAKDTALFYRAVEKSLKTALIVGILVFLPIIVFSKELISLTIGSEYLPVRATLNMMIAGIILVLFNFPFSTGLIAGYFEKEVLKQALACACFSLASNFILMPRYGMFGASVSFLLTEALALVWVIWVYQKKIGLKGSGGVYK